MNQLLQEAFNRAEATTPLDPADLAADPVAGRLVPTNALRL